MQRQQARRIGAPPVAKFLASNGRGAVSRIVDCPEFGEFIRRGDGTESELMSVSIHWRKNPKAVFSRSLSLVKKHRIAEFRNHLLEKFSPQTIPHSSFSHHH